MRLHPDEYPEKPLRCSCGGTEFRWEHGYRGSFTEPPEPSGWMCTYCESMDFAPEDFWPLEGEEIES